LDDSNIIQFSEVNFFQQAIAYAIKDTNDLSGVETKPEYVDILVPTQKPFLLFKRQQKGLL
jgi:hypothetical protein